MKTFYEVFWKEGLEPELIFFFDELNWTYIIMLSIILYGIKHTDLLDWFVKLCEKIKIKKYSYWMAAIVTGVVFVIFRELEYWDVNASYISGLLRSMFFTVVFSNIVVDIPVYMIKGFGKFIDTKTNQEQKDKTEV